MERDRATASLVVEALRKGVPPKKGVELYTAGHLEKLISGIRRFHLSDLSTRGVIRFVSGSWGAGKTHLFRLLKETAFDHGCLVSNVELNNADAALNRFESVLYSIVRNIATPRHASTQEAAPFGNVVREALHFLATGEHAEPHEVTYEQYERATRALMSDRTIDIDFKKMVQEYWKTFLPDGADPVQIDQVQGEILQWFSGEGVLAAYRKRFGVNKMVGKDNARLMLQSLAGFIRLAGFNGLVILFDEAEKSYSLMRKSQLKDAHNNLLALVSNIDDVPGMFLIYATTPDFFTDPKHGIVVYGALATRIGRPEDHSPKALDRIWNLDAVEVGLELYQAVAKKVRAIYATAFPDVADRLPGDGEVEVLVAGLLKMHPGTAPVRFWRVLVSGLVVEFDTIAEDGAAMPTEELYDDVMDRLRED